MPQRDWLQPLHRGAEPAPRPSALPAAGGDITFERAVERYIANHLSPRTGRPYSATSRQNIRDNLLGGPCSEFRRRHDVRLAREWSAERAVEYLRWLQMDMGRDSDTVKKVRGQLRQFAADCAEQLGHRDRGERDAVDVEQAELREAVAAHVAPCRSAAPRLIELRVDDAPGNFWCSESARTTGSSS